MSTNAATGGPPNYSTSNLTGSAIGLSHTTLTTNGTYTFPNHSGSIVLGNTDCYINLFDFEEKTVDLEKLSKMDSVKRQMIMDLLLSFIKCEDYNTKKLIYNTLETYSIITDKKALLRKVKISNIISNETSK